MDFFFFISQLVLLLSRAPKKQEKDKKVSGALQVPFALQCFECLCMLTCSLAFSLCCRDTPKTRSPNRAVR